MIVPRIGGRVRLLEDKMFLTVKGEEVADRESGLSAQLWC